jgi:hypothetical protein
MNDAEVESDWELIEHPKIGIISTSKVSSCQIS